MVPSPGDRPAGMTSTCLPDLVVEKRGDVCIWWFPRDFSQSRLGDRTTGSNACTLIVLLISQKCYQGDIQILPREKEPISQRFVAALAESIIEGN
ncbi:unnamed protein product, partial [Timema podura]|nr:unnamed protein product [Timema podura]